MSKLSTFYRSSNRSSWRCHQGREYTAVCVCLMGLQGQRISVWVTETGIYQFMVMKAKVKVLSVRTHTLTNLQDRIVLVSQFLLFPCIPWVRGVLLQLLFLSSSDNLLVSLSPFLSYKRSSHVGLGATPVRSYLPDTHNTLGSRTWLLDFHSIWCVVYCTYHIFCVKINSGVCVCARAHACTQG